MSAGAFPRLRIGVSSCLLGQRVRYDGGHKRDRFLVEALGPYADWFPLCPEVEIGMGTPREPIRLVGDAASPRLVGVASGVDHSERMRRWAAAQVEAIAARGLHGYVLKRDSPSCGLLGVPVWGEDGEPPRHVGRGLFTAELSRRLPLLPIEEEGRLADPRRRDSFLARLYAGERWQRFLATDPRRTDLVAFHATEALLLRAHSPRHARALGRLAGRPGRAPLAAVLARYGAGLGEALAVAPTRGRHARALAEVAGALAASLSRSEAAELGRRLRDHRRGLVPLATPLELLADHLRRHRAPEWIRRQTYLAPYPRELMPRDPV